MGQGLAPGLCLRRFSALFFLCVFAFAMATLLSQAVPSAQLFNVMFKPTLALVSKGMSTGSSHCMPPALETNVVFLFLLLQNSQ